MGSVSLAKCLGNSADISLSFPPRRSRHAGSPSPTAGCLFSSRCTPPPPPPTAAAVAFRRTITSTLGRCAELAARRTPPPPLPEARLFERENPRPEATARAASAPAAGPGAQEEPRTDSRRRETAGSSSSEPATCAGARCRWPEPNPAEETGRARTQQAVSTRPPPSFPTATLWPCFDFCVRFSFHSSETPAGGASVSFLFVELWGGTSD